MDIWRFAGAFAVAQRQGECGGKTAEMHVSQPMSIGVCYVQFFVSNFHLKSFSIQFLYFFFTLTANGWVLAFVADARLTTNDY